MPEAAIRHMTAATMHRGPDAMAFHKAEADFGRIYFGHNRLKILDISDKANQPFFSEDGRYVLLFNGEIYNYPELRQSLRRQGSVFRTESDTEVVLQLLIRNGQPGLAQLNGMFALAFYDAQEQYLWLARDRFGIKPLFYLENESYLIVSSEIKGILRSGLVKKEINQAQIYQYLCYKHAAKPQTFYRHILELKEGHLLNWRKEKSHLPTYLLPPPPEEKYANPQKLARRAESLLLDSVQKHLLADVPVGLFLSGGIDSTLLLALLHRAGHRHFPAFSIVHKATEGSFATEDARFARLAAQQYKADHTCFEINESMLADTDSWVQSLDQPIADGAGLVTAYLTQKVKPYIKVALSGAGADELFAGYNRHRAFYLYLKQRHLALFFKQILQPLSPLLPVGFNHPLRKKFLLLQKLTTKIHKSPGQTFLNFTSMDFRLSQLCSGKNIITDPAPELAALTPQDWLKWALQHDQHQYLISDILAVTDQAGMQHSLEIRTPFLENHLQAFMANQPTDLLFRNGQKWILKDILAAHGGQVFLRRAKEGFGMPLGSWLRKPQNQFVLAELQSARCLIFNYLDYTRTQQMLQSHLRRRQDYSTEIWALVVLAKWLEHNFN